MRLRYALPVLLLVAVLVAAFAFLAPVPTVQADDDLTCTTETISWEILNDWASKYARLQVTTAEQVVRVFGITVFTGPTTVVDFQFEYINAQGQTVLASGSFTLSDSCTPDFMASVDGAICDVSSVVEHYEETLAEGSIEIVVMSYDDWYVWALDIGFFQIGTHYEQYELVYFYYEYLISIGIDVETITRSCYFPWVPGPVTLHLDGNGSLREPFVVQAYFVNPGEHPDLDSALRSDPHSAVRNSSYLGELMYEGVVDVPGNGDAYVVLAPYSEADGYNVLVVLYGVEDGPVFAGYWSVYDAPEGEAPNGEMEASLISFADSFFTGGHYTHQQ